MAWFALHPSFPGTTERELGVVGEDRGHGDVVGQVELDVTPVERHEVDRSVVLTSSQWKVMTNVVPTAAASIG